jgi:hypothetical protein
MTAAIGGDGRSAVSLSQPRAEASTSVWMVAGDPITACQVSGSPRIGPSVRGAPYTSGVTNDDESHPGMPALDRQDRPIRLDVRGRPVIPSRVPETRPTPLQAVFIYLSIGVLVCGVIAIMALELGASFGSPWVKLPSLIGGALLLAVTIDAIVRIWRSAKAWMLVDPATGLFRVVWVGVLAAAAAATVAVMVAAAVA